MKAGYVRSFMMTSIAIVGVFLGIGAATAFNAAGLVWSGRFFEHALYWEPLESSITVFFGCVLLMGWLISVVGVVVLSRTGDPHPNARRRRLGIALVSGSLLLTAALMFISLVVLPAQYEWVKY